MVKDTSWEDTFLDSKCWNTAFERLGSKKNVILYFISIIMYIVCFVFLFQKGTSEYISYVLVFIVNAIFPFLWIIDFRDFISRVDFSGSSIPILGVDVGTNFIRTLMSYREWGIYLALTFQFIALFFVVLKNENVRKMKKINEKESDMRAKEKDLETNNALTEKYDKTILALFVTIITIIWSLLGDTFSFPINENLDTNKAFLQSESYTYLMRTIKWLTSQPYRFLENIDNGWLYYMERINTTPLVKAFFMYCIVFIVLIFSFFIRIPKAVHKNPSKFAPIERFKIVNIESPFPAVFERNLDKYRCLAIAFFCMILIFLLALVMYLLHSFFNVPKVFVQGVLFVGAILFIACLFGKRKEAFPDSNSVKKLVFFLLSVIFGFTGTPVVLSVLQLFTEIGIFSGIQQFFMNMYATYTGNPESFTPSKTLNTGNVLSILTGVIFTVLTFMIYGLGVDNNWLSNVDGKPFLTFIAVLICMGVSLFMALTTAYPLLSTLFTFFHKIAQLVLLFVAPLAILIFAVIQFAFAFKNHEKYKVYEKIDRRLKAAAKK